MQHCDACGRAVAASRRDAVYCSNACRQRAYRDRVRESEGERFQATAEGQAKLAEFEEFLAGPFMEQMDLHAVTDSSRNAEGEP